MYIMLIFIFNSRKVPSVLLQLGCPLVPYLFIFGALMDKVLNWQRIHEHEFLKYLPKLKNEAFLSSF
jgi:hypothetical protein